MRVGNKKQYDHMVNTSSAERRVRIDSVLEWLGDMWVIREDGDGPVEKERYNTMMAAQARTPEIVPVPSLVSRAVSYIKAVTGALVDDEVFNTRLRACTEEGGWTTASLEGDVTSVTATSITINQTVVLLQDGESSTVAQGDKVVRNQPIAEGRAKSCPHLQRKVDNGQEKLYCGGCGCGQRAAAELHTKLRYASATCPRRFPLFKPV